MTVGQVIRSHSNIFYVLTDGEIVECRPRGRFRLDRQEVLTGDLVEVHREKNEGRIDKVLPRRTCLQRPAVANVDQALVVFTLKEPEADFQFLDRVLIHAEQAGVRAIILLNKVDLVEPEVVAAFCHAYGEQVGFDVLPISAKQEIGLEELWPRLVGKVSVLAGHSGVGKSRLVRALEPARDDVRVGELSEKLGRGKHTTRHVELVPLTRGGLLADTPGFTYLEFEGMEKQQVPKLFREFTPYAAECRFSDCMHRKEPDCAVRDAVEAGQIPRTRYESYLVFLGEIEAMKRW